MKFTVEAPDTLIKFLQSKIGCSISKVKKKIKYQNVYIDREINYEHNPEVSAGQVVELGELSSPKSNLRIIFEDDDLIAVEKPINLLTMGTGKMNEQTQYQEVNEHIKQNSHNRLNAHIIHRLDKDVSGILLFAKNKEMQEDIISGWRTYEKKYFAVVEGLVTKDNDRLVNWLRENKQYQVYVTKESEESKKAITSYKVLKKSKDLTLLDISIETGRKNQIRVQLAEIGHPIIGDPKFGAKTNAIKRIGLHAHTLKFTHPKTNETIVLNTKTPPAFSRLFR